MSLPLTEQNASIERFNRVTAALTTFINVGLLSCFPLALLWKPINFILIEIAFLVGSFALPITGGLGLLHSRNFLRNQNQAHKMRRWWRVCIALNLLTIAIYILIWIGLIYLIFAVLTTERTES